eukprot:CAMPEP_0182524772 /NCGR_PEP_ID=MMETSP1323-20130603/2017_1 /TAXON_ID=236787 /ORGANISM="Florenciella parvula, Strain RCC1693" /LENGTH=66 /DNA_ID=CAMNT_0024733391 /DNA_START=195 /DNA_END=395 /DNA_ORIENTATION=+
MNGKCGVAIDYAHYQISAPSTKDRYTVRLDSGEVFKVKPASVRAEGASADKVKVKGKGKKGRGGRK